MLNDASTDRTSLNNGHITSLYKCRIYTTVKKYWCFAVRAS